MFLPNFLGRITLSQSNVYSLSRFPMHFTSDLSNIFRWSSCVVSMKRTSRPRREWRRKEATFLNHISLPSRRTYPAAVKDMKKLDNGYVRYSVCASDGLRTHTQAWSLRRVIPGGIVALLTQSWRTQHLCIPHFRNPHQVYPHLKSRSTSFVVFFSRKWRKWFLKCPRRRLRSIPPASRHSGWHWSLSLTVSILRFVKMRSKWLFSIIIVYFFYPNFWQLVLRESPSSRSCFRIWRPPSGINIRLQAV